LRAPGCAISLSARKTTGNGDPPPERPPCCGRSSTRGFLAEKLVSLILCRFGGLQTPSPGPGKGRKAPVLKSPPRWRMPLRVPGAAGASRAGGDAEEQERPGLGGAAGLGAARPTSRWARGRSSAVRWATPRSPVRSGGGL